MRVGSNPVKNKRNEASGYLHHVIIPVYIPHHKDYFKDSLQILKLCLQSLFGTIHSKTYISIVNNGSSKDVSEFLESLLKDERIHELIRTGNIGKINAILKGLVGHKMPLVTIADADVFFLSGWQEATYEVFGTFERAGVVGLTPQFKSYENRCGNIISSNLFSNKLRFTDVREPEALKKFYKSLGWDESYNGHYLKKNLTISLSGIEAVVGSGHYVATYKRSVFGEIFTYDSAKMGLNSENKLDEMPLKKNLWRLTTSGNYAYHMGNVLEDWMEEETKKLEPSKDSQRKLPFLGYVQNENRFLYFIKNRLFVKLFSTRWFKQWFYSYKGLPKGMRKNY
jgi:hypothetical protein